MKTQDIKKIIEEILTHLSLEYDAVEEDILLNQPLFRIKTNASGALIGSRGERIRALNHIIKQMVKKQTTEPIQFSIDVNDYRSKKIREIEEIAHLLAKRALSLKYDVEMQPMSSYERMIVHTTLADTEHINTASIGEDKERRVVIKYTTS